MLEEKDNGWIYGGENGIGPAWGTIPSAEGNIQRQTRTMPAEMQKAVSGTKREDGILLVQLALADFLDSGGTKSKNYVKKRKNGTEVLWMG